MDADGSNEGDLTPDEIRRASRRNLPGLERLAIALGLKLPGFPREWRGYRRELAKRVIKRLGIRKKIGWD